MSNKYSDKKGWKVPKQHYKVSNWSDYNKALCHRGRLDLWVSDEVADSWYEEERINDGTGAPRVFTDLAIMTCHEVRQVFHLPLRQTQGFMNSLFNLAGLELHSPSYSSLSKRLSGLSLKTPAYKNKKFSDNDVAAIAIDSTGLKRFGRGEWHQEKHKLSGKRSWRKLHIAVDNHHVIQASDITDRFAADCQLVETLAEKVEGSVNHITAGGAYDKGPVYDTLSVHFDQADTIIPPDSNAVYDKDNDWQRNRSYQEIKTFGRMGWQRARDYGRRNYSELAVQRYMRILGNQLRAREFSRQKNEAFIGCGILNKMTSLGMPKSYRCA